jgi:hypothetical protein
MEYHGTYRNIFSHTGGEGRGKGPPLPVSCRKEMATLLIFVVSGAPLNSRPRASLFLFLFQRDHRRCLKPVRLSQAVTLSGCQAIPIPIHHAPLTSGT